MAVTAKSRAKLQARISTTMDPVALKAALRRAADAETGGGVSLLTSGVQNLGARVHVERERDDGFDMSINSGKRIVELCTFSANLATAGGVTTATVGGLETYKTTQTKVLEFIPVSPKRIAGFSRYQRFLDSVRSEVLASDPAAQVQIVVPES